MSNTQLWSGKTNIIERRGVLQSKLDAVQEELDPRIQRLGDTYLDNILHKARATYYHLVDMKHKRSEEQRFFN
jgi:uncharacterized protein YktB (UPF0637 family)